MQLQGDPKTMPSSFPLAYWKSGLLLLLPLLLLPLPLATASPAGNCAYVLLLMAFSWMLDLLPLPVTALVPVALFPMLGIMSTSAVAANYMRGTCMLFVGGLIVAIAIEHSDLHRRLALYSLRLVGTAPRFLLLGFMLPTALLSMWISNLATTAMMIPILEAVLNELEGEEEKEYLGITGQSLPPAPKGPTNETEVRSKQRQATRAMLAMAICYSANIGGTGTIIGTPCNIVLIEYLEVFQGHPLNFSSWIVFALPQVFLCLLMLWLWLQLYYLPLPFSESARKSAGASRVKEKAVAVVIRKKCQELGPLSFHEAGVLLGFVMLLFLWFFRSPGFMPGWGDLLATQNPAGQAVSVSDATPALLVALYMFIMPAKPNFLRRLAEPSPPLLDWPTLQAKMPWGLVLLIGGGFALADGVEKSGLSSWIASNLQGLRSLDDWLVCLVVCLMISLLTQIASNLASASMLLPVMRDLALTLGINPLYLMLPPTLVSSYAFILPVSTAPNVVAFASSGMTTFDMAKLGVVMNLLCLLVVMLCINTYGIGMFDLDQFPAWAEAYRNGTVVLS